MKLTLSNIGFVSTVLALILAGCSSSAKSNGADSTSDSGSGIHLDVGCMMDHVDKPSENFHYSYKYASDTTWENYEADVTTTSIDGSAKTPMGSSSLHAVRSNSDGWDTAVLALSSLSFTALTGRLTALDGTTAITSQGAEQVNGFSATKYSIDTVHASASDQQSLETLLGKGSFDKGTIWMDHDGCAVKVLLDEGWPIDNGVQKRHYEIARIKK
ncbi:MAG TPA: hypothetical protein VFU57_11920 [Candidatus Acidoferrales bacterium]|nr:hypothetical protein [Candidatus Acidoferrales bacterium]